MNNNDDFFVPDFTAETEAQLKSKRVRDFLKTCDEDDIQELFNTASFNRIAKGYVKKALDCLETDKETRRSILSELDWQFDTVGAREAEEYYHEH